MRKFCVSSLIVALLCVGIATVANAQDWRRQLAPQGGIRLQPQTNPTTRSDFFGPQGRTGQSGRSYGMDPSAMSDASTSDRYVRNWPPAPTTPPWNPWVYPPYVYPPAGPTAFYPPPGYITASQKFLGVTTSPWGGGAYVTSVVDGSPAFRVGIEVGDVIYSIDGVNVGSQGDLARAVQYSDGFVEIYVRDVRTGQMVMRNVDVTQ